MKEIYYLGFYNDHLPSSRKNIGFNPAGTMKMNYIISVIKKLNYKLTIISITYDKNFGFHKREEVIIDENIKIVFVPYFTFRLLGRNIFSVSTSIFFLKKILKRNLAFDSILISYHALEYKKMLVHLHEKIKFKWISEVEEIYSLSRIRRKTSKEVNKEIAYFLDSDAFIFVNEYLANKYSQGKKYVVSYGNCEFHQNKKDYRHETINVAYTGIINQERGAFLLLEAMRYLSDDYRLNILGFGSIANIELFKDKIKYFNNEFGFEKIKFFGTKTGDEFSEFLFQNDIGISLIDTSVKEVSNNAFPSKIMVYLSHGLSVVSTDCESIRMSKVANCLHFCQNNPQDIAAAIKMIEIKENINYKNILESIESNFIRDFVNMLEG